MKPAKRTLIAIILLAVVLPALAAQVNPSPDIQELSKQEFTGAMVITTLTGWLHTGAAILFLQGIAGFKASMRKAYFLICLGLLGMTITHIQVPFMIYLGLFETPWVTNGGLTFPYVVAYVLLYLGLCIFSKDLKHRDSWVNPALVLPAVAAISVASGFVFSGERGFYGELAGNMAVVCLNFVNIGLAWRIKQTIGPAYTNALAWFFVVLMTHLLSALPPLVFLIMGKEPGAILALGGLLTGILFVKAGYAFNKIQEY